MSRKLSVSSSTTTIRGKNKVQQTAPLVETRLDSVTRNSLFPIRDKIPGTANRLKGIGNAPVKVLDIDKSGLLLVNFLDKDSIKRYKRLLFQMNDAYSSPGVYFKYQIPLEELQLNQIVAGVVPDLRERDHSSSVTTVRRVRIVRVEDNASAEQKVEVIGEGIDDGRRQKLVRAYSLIDGFYKHPSQLCRVKILNLTDFYCENTLLRTLRPYFKQPEELESVVSLVVHKTWVQLLTNEKLELLKLKSTMEGNLQIFKGEVSRLKAKGDKRPKFLNWRCRVHSNLLDMFCNHFSVNALKVGDVSYDCEIVSVRCNGNIGVTPTSSLFHVIDEMINNEEIRSFVMSDADRQLMLDSVARSRTLKLLAYNEEMDRINRIEALGLYDGKITARLLDRGGAKATTVSIKPESLICPLLKNPLFNDLLPIIPPQAQTYHLYKVHALTKEQSANLLGKKVHIKVVSQAASRADFPEVEIFDCDVRGTSNNPLNTDIALAYSWTPY